jgi:hypothetical protein
MNIYQKLNEARSLFNNLELKKSGHNKFAGYTYFELGDFLPSALNIFEDVGLCAVISFGSGFAEMRIVETAGDGQIVIESPMADAALKGCHPIQNLGAVHTYMRRYLWVLALEITEHDALDSTTGSSAGFDPDAVVERYMEQFANAESVIQLREQLKKARSELQQYPGQIKILRDHATFLAEKIKENHHE